MSKPVASLSLDLDNKWAYLKTHGDDGWESFPSYLDLVTPRILDVLDHLNLKITVFVVGQDAALEKNHAALKAIVDAGHEIANHSFHHEPWLHLYTPEQLEKEFDDTERAIMEATGQKPVGFRGPGFSLSDQVLYQLEKRDYQYDCSTFPTFLGPVARMYYFLTASFSKSEKEERKQLFGKLSDGFQPLKPFYWNLPSSNLLEIPVTTMPLFKLPIHLSYLHFLSQYSTWVSKLYFWKAMKLCRICGVGPSLLLHPLDFLGADDDEDLRFFPGMKLESKKKISLVQSVLKRMSNDFDVVPMKTHAARVKSNTKKHRSIDWVRTGVAQG